MKYFLIIHPLIEDLANYKDVKEISYAANNTFNNKKINYKIDKIDYVINARGYKNERKTFNFVQKYNKLYREKLKFYNLKTKKMREIDIYSAFLELQKVGLNFKGNNDNIYQLKLAKDLKTLTKKFTWDALNLNYAGYYRDMNLIFFKQNDIWYYQNTSCFISYNDLLKAFPSPNDQLVGRLINKFFKTFVHADNNVITTEDLYKKNEQ